MAFSGRYGGHMYDMGRMKMGSIVECETVRKCIYLEELYSNISLLRLINLTIEEKDNDIIKVDAVKLMVKCVARTAETENTDGGSSLFPIKYHDYEFTLTDFVDWWIFMFMNGQQLPRLYGHLLRLLSYVIKREKWNEEKLLHYLFSDRPLTHLLAITFEMESNDSDYLKKITIRIIQQLLHSKSPNRYIDCTLINPLISYLNEPSFRNNSEHESLVLWTICEMLYLTPQLLMEFTRYSIILHKLIELSSKSICKSVLLSMLNVLEFPSTRRIFRNEACHIDALLAPLTDTNYLHFPPMDRDDEMRRIRYRLNAKNIVIYLLHTWAGLSRFSDPSDNTLHSLVNCMNVENVKIRDLALDLFYELFNLVKPSVDCRDYRSAVDSVFSVAQRSEQSPITTSVNDSVRNRITVFQEALNLLPNRSAKRPNLKENVFAILLYGLIDVGILENLIDLIVNEKNDHCAMKAIVLLAHMLHLSDNILPDEKSFLLLPTLVNHAFRESDTIPSITCKLEGYGDYGLQTNDKRYLDGGRFVFERHMHLLANKNMRAIDTVSAIDYYNRKIYERSLHCSILLNNLLTMIDTSNSTPMIHFISMNQAIKGKKKSFKVQKSFYEFLFLDDYHHVGDQCEMYQISIPKLHEKKLRINCPSGDTTPTNKNDNNDDENDSMGIVEVPSFHLSATEEKLLCNSVEKKKDTINKFGDFQSKPTYWNLKELLSLIQMPIRFLVIKSEFILVADVLGKYFSPANRIFLNYSATRRSANLGTELTHIPSHCYNKFEQLSPKRSIQMQEQMIDEISFINLPYFQIHVRDLIHFANQFFDRLIRIGCLANYTSTLLSFDEEETEESNETKIRRASLFIRVLHDFLDNVAKELKILIKGRDPELSIFSEANIYFTCARYYPMLLGIFTRSYYGNRLLREHGIYSLLQLLLQMERPYLKKNASLIRLILTSFDFSGPNCVDGVHDARILLKYAASCKYAQVKADVIRLLLIHFRLNATNFHIWAFPIVIELIDERSPMIRLFLMNVLQELLDDDNCLNQFVENRVNISTKFGQLGFFLQTLTYCQVESLTLTWIQNEVQKWFNKWNCMYVEYVERHLAAAFSTYELQAKDMEYNLDDISRDKENSYLDTTLKEKRMKKTVFHDGNEELLDDGAFHRYGGRNERLQSTDSYDDDDDDDDSPSSSLDDVPLSLYRFTYEEKNENYVMNSEDRHVDIINDFYLPPHLFGQLVKNDIWREHLLLHPELDRCIDLIRSCDQYKKASTFSKQSKQLKRNERVLQIKASLWALGHCLTTSKIDEWQQTNRIIPKILRIAEECSCVSIRGTAYLVIGLIASTSYGVNLLKEFGWESYVHARSTNAFNFRTNLFDSSNLFQHLPDGQVSGEFNSMRSMTSTTLKSNKSLETLQQMLPFVLSEEESGEVKFHISSSKTSDSSHNGSSDGIGGDEKDLQKIISGDDEDDDLGDMIHQQQNDDDDDSNRRQPAIVEQTPHTQKAMQQHPSIERRRVEGFRRKPNIIQRVDDHYFISDEGAMGLIYLRRMADDNAIQRYQARQQENGAFRIITYRPDIDNQLIGNGMNPSFSTILLNNWSGANLNSLTNISQRKSYHDFNLNRQMIRRKKSKYTDEIFKGICLPVDTSMIFTFDETKKSNNYQPSINFSSTFPHRMTSSKKNSVKIVEGKQQQQQQQSNESLLEKEEKFKNLPPPNPNNPSQKIYNNSSDDMEMNHKRISYNISSSNVSSAVSTSVESHSTVYDCFSPQGRNSNLFQQAPTEKIAIPSKEDSSKKLKRSRQNSDRSQPLNHHRRTIVGRSAHFHRHRRPDKNQKISLALMSKKCLFCGGDRYWRLLSPIDNNIPLTTTTTIINNNNNNNNNINPGRKGSILKSHSQYDRKIYRTLRLTNEDFCSSNDSMVSLDDINDVQLQREILVNIQALACTVKIRLQKSQRRLQMIRDERPHLFRDCCLYWEVCVLLSACHFEFHQRRWIRSLFATYFNECQRLKDKSNHLQELFSNISQHLREDSQRHLPVGHETLTKMPSTCESIIEEDDLAEITTSIPNTGTKFFIGSRPSHYDDEFSSR
ncbi:hypothetical protein SNEBB_010855 [Seison nebaliae]|nr:hypothetical protein SNEBB_010855 [Seison nebaliae]